MAVSATFGTLDIGVRASEAVKDNLTLSVVIPALNEENGIEDIVRRIQSAQPGLQELGVKGLEIIVVDDGSEDRTAEIVESLAGARLLRHTVNRGYGGAIKTGFSQARGDLLAFLDADGTYPPEHFPALCRTLLDQKADIVVGSRRSGENSQMPAMRRVGNFIWSNLVTLLGDQRVIDPASGMRVMRRDVLPRLYPLPDGLNFTPVMSTRSVHEKLKVVEIAIPYAERVGNSKLTIVGDGTRFLMTILWTVLQYNPVRLFGTIGLSAIGIAAVIALGILGLRLQGVDFLGPWGLFSLFGAVVLGVSGVSLTALGITFSYLVALFHNEPLPESPLQGKFINKPLNYHFGWLGILSTFTGIAFAIGTLVLGLNGWEVMRLWFWLLSSALLILVGVQLSVSWVIMRVLEVLNQRENDVAADIKGWMVK